MSGTFFDYVPGRLEARFRHDDRFDSVLLDLWVTGETAVTADCDDLGRMTSPVEHVSDRVECQVYMTSVFCPFRDFIRFLEAIAIEVQECGFEWDPEGPMAKMSWTRRFVADAGFLTVEWRSGEERFNHRMMLGTRQAVESLYTAFRSFVESDDYDPLRYEEVTIGEAFSLVMSNASLDDLARALAHLNANDADAVIGRLKDAVGTRSRGKAKICRPIEYFFESDRAEPAPIETESWTGAQWDSQGLDQRIAELRDLFGSGGLGWHGANLRALRSSLVENWLALPESVPRPSYLALRH